MGSPPPWSGDVTSASTHHAAEAISVLLADLPPASPTGSRHRPLDLVEGQEGDGFQR